MLCRSTTSRHMSEDNKKVTHDMDGDGQVDRLEVVSMFVRLGILCWSGAILTLNYVSIPGVPQRQIDPTFIASVFTGTLATFGVQTAKRSGDSPKKEAPQVQSAIKVKDEQKVSSRASSKEQSDEKTSSPPPS